MAAQAIHLPPTAGALERPAPLSLLHSLTWTTSGWAGLLARLSLAAVFFPHGAQKAFGWFGGHGLVATMDGFQQMGLPGWLGVLVMMTELGGSILLALGLLTRVAAFGILCVMAGAIATVHYQIGFFMNWSGQQAGEGFEFHLLAIGLCLALIAGGAGHTSADEQIARETAPGL